jgi:hypothetical protein
MAITVQNPTELEIETDVMDGDRLRFEKLPSGELALYLGNPEGGLYGSAMKASTLLSPTERAALKAWL